MTVTLELKTSQESAHSHAITSVAYSPDGSQIISCGADTNRRRSIAAPTACVGTRAELPKRCLPK